MKIIVFGGAGFLGSHVADELSASGHDVIIFDKNHSKYLSAGQREIVGDISNNCDVEKAISGCDVVYNYAGVSDIYKAKADPVTTVRNNILGNTILLDCSRRALVKQFIFASSLYVYSDTGSFYRSSKQACELIIDNYRTVFGLDYTILRYGSLYGPRSNEENWMYYMLKQALTERKIIRYGDGGELREYIHVKDAARLSVEVINNDEYKNHHVIIAGLQQMKIKDLLVMVREMLKGELKIEYMPNMESENYEITPYVFKPTMAKRLNSNHYFDLGQGILEMMGDIYKENVVTSEIDFFATENIASGQ